MQIKILYFARIREAVGQSEEVLALADGETWTITRLIVHLHARGETWQRGVSEPLRYAVNEEFATATTALANGDEVALFPPVTGG